MNRDGDSREAVTFRYWGFISYSHKDERRAAWLQRKLEGYSGHSKLVGNPRGEPLPKRLFPIFRDREELAGAADLSEHIQQALRESRYLIVICSPNSAKSRWVNDEIKAFKSFGGETRVLALIIDGEPNASDNPDSTLPECFPEALRYRIGSNGALLSERTEPIAADARKGKDGERNALLKLISGILGVRFDELRRRDQERAARRRTWITAGSLAIAAIFAAIAGFAYNQQLIAEERSRIALSRQLAAQALSELPAASASGRQSDYALGLLLAVQALHAKPTIEARSVLLKALLSSPYRVKFLWGHTAPITSVVCAPDGKTIASASEDGRIVLWDATTQEPLGTLPGAHQGSVTSLAFSPRGNILASGGRDHTVRLWNLTTRQPLGEPLSGPREMVKTVAFSPDGGMVASGGGGDIASTGELFVWELSSREPPRTPTNKSSEAVHHRPIEGIAFSPDGKTLVSASRDGMLVFWDLPSLEPIRTLEGHQFASIAFNRGGQILASGGRSGVGTRSIVKEPYGLILWDLAGASPRAISSAEAIDDVRSVTFDGGNVLASGGPDGRVILWDIGGDKVTMRPLPGHKDTVTSMSFSSDSQTLVSGSADGTVILRDLRGGALSVVLEYEPNREAAAANPFYAIQRLALSSDGKMLAFQGPRGKIILWDVVTGIPRRELSQPGAAPISVAFTPDAKTLAAASPESLVSWDVSSGASRVAWIKHAGEIDGRSFSADGKVIALKMPDHSVLLWDMANGAAVGAPLSGHREALTDLAFSPDGKTLASGSEDGAVMLWNIASRQPLEPPFPARAGRVENLTFSRNGNMLAFAVSDGKQSRLALWNGVRRESADLSFAQPTSLLRLAFSPDAKVLAAATRTGDVLLWNVMSRQPLGSLTGHEKPVANFMFSSAGDTLISVDESGTALLWDMLRRSSVGRVFLGHAQGVRNVVIGNDANVVVSSSLWGNELIVTDWDPASWAKHACQAANRELTRNEWDQFVGIDAKQEPICPRPASLHAARTISQDRGVDPIY